jgi:hypothetical protein
MDYFFVAPLYRDPNFVSTSTLNPAIKQPSPQSIAGWTDFIWKKFANPA